MSLYCHSAAVNLHIAGRGGGSDERPGVIFDFFIYPHPQLCYQRRQGIIFMVFVQKVTSKLLNLL